METEVELVRENEDIGTFKLVPKGTANFKSSFRSDTKVFYGNSEIYSGEIVIKNIGYDVGRGLNFKISLENAKTFEKKSVLGSIPVNGEKRVGITFSFNEQFKNMKNYILVVEIKDASNRKWLDKVEIPVYKGDFEISLKAQNSIQGVIQKPNGLNINFSGKEKTINLPLISPEQSYYLVFTNYQDYESESIYGLAINSEIGTFEGFEETSRFEPNENIETAKNLNLGDSIVNYIHFEDIDYFKISTKEDLEKSYEDIHNKQPIAKLTYSFSGEKLNFDFSETVDENIVEYILSSNIDGELYRGLETGFLTENLSEESNHTIILKVVDKFGLEDSVNIEVEITKRNRPPIADLRFDVSGFGDGKFSEDNEIRLDGSKSSDDRGISEYRFFSNLDGELRKGENSDLWTKLSQGEHNISLTVTDSDGVSTTVSKTLNILGTPNISPVAKIGTLSKTYYLNSKIIFKSESSDSDGNIVGYLWSSNLDGVLGSSKILKISTLSEGNHTISLKVTDNDGGESLATGKFEVVESKSRVLKTGQTETYYSGDDGTYQIGLERRYSRSGNSVTDLTTGLIWQDGSEVVFKNWSSAKTYCNNLSLDGNSDWRLPTLKELVTIVDYGKSDPAIDPVFQNTKTNDYYWTITKYNSYSSTSWFVNFGNGYDSGNDQTGSDYVRCVR